MTPPQPNSPVNTDRNLLFGILALQTDLISRDALIAGMSAWAVAKDKPLGQILVEQGALRPENRALLESLVAANLKAHDGDPQQSLAVLSSVAGVQKDLQAIADTDVQASLAHLPPTPPADADPQATRAPDSSPPSIPLRFRVLRPHAKGGLGEVFVARDEELHREVALKEIQNQHADDPHRRARFVLEAEITGGLEHPGIVPVYGLGAYPNGRPFYAMRFIRGDSLHEALNRFHKADGPGRDPRERNLAFRELLGRFVNVCQAVAYAHSRGVLHRDLKPGNIMLGRYGETLVVDWGLAKPLGQAAPDTPEGPLTPVSGSRAAPTVAGTAIGTPAYMSPEQAAGRLDVLGPPSDVYSLGATLYHLLTGRPPFAGQDLGAVLRQVQAGDYRPLRQVKPQVPAALAAICRKAMRRRPEERYATPAVLAQDVERWLADEAVGVYREPWPSRLGRWGRRHRGWAAGTAAAVGVALVSLAVGLLVVAGKNRALTEANARETKAREDAQARKQQAEENFTLALEGLKELVFGVQEKLANRSGTQELRKALLGTAVDGLARLAQHAEQTHGTDRTTAWAYLTLGDIFLRIEGQSGQALQEYQRGLEICQRRATDDPKDAQAQRDLSISYTKLGDVYLRLGRTADALKAYQDDLAIRQRRATDDPHSFEGQTDLAVSYSKLGQAEQQALAFESAAAWYGQGLTVLKTLDQQGKLQGTRFANWMGIIEKAQAFCSAAVRAVASLEFALAQPKAEVPRLLSARCGVLARRGQHAEAAVTAEKLAALHPVAAGNVYNAACGLAQCAAAAGKPPKPDPTLGERYAARAVALLAQAQTSGYFKDPAHAELLQIDKDLDPLRARVDFKKLAAAVGKAIKN
jgi:serine/threonine-protein kinase